MSDADEIARVVGEGIRLARALERLIAIGETLTNFVHQITELRKSGLIGDDLDPELTALLEALRGVEDALASAGRVVGARLDLLIE